MNLVEKTKHQLFSEKTEEGKQRFLDTFNQINKLKDIDVNQYIQDLEKNLILFKKKLKPLLKPNSLKNDLISLLLRFLISEKTNQ